MIKLWQLIRNKFLTIKFITFGFIGVLNTGIHLTVYWIFHNQIGLDAFMSNSFAFITASTFSYFANAIFTFKPKRKTYKQFTSVILVFLVRLLISSSLTGAFDYMIIHWFGVDYEAVPWAVFIAPFLGSALLIPVAYFALDYVFKITGSEKKHS